MPNFKFEITQWGTQREKDDIQRHIKGNFIREDAKYFNVKVLFRLV